MKTNDDAPDGDTLNQQQRTADDLFNRLPVACVETSTTGFIHRVSDEAVVLLNVPRGFCVGRPLIAFVARRDCPAFREMKQQALTSVAIERRAMQIRPRHGRAPIAVDVVVRRVDQRLLWTVLPQSEARAPSSRPGPLPRVLHLEDDVDIREMLEEILVAQGFAVEGVSTLAEARNAFDAAPFDVVITNYQLPDGDGTSFLEWVGEDRLRVARAVMITGHPKARRVHGIPCWMKPIDPTKVGLQVRQLFEARPRV